MNLSDSPHAEMDGAQPSHETGTAAKLLADATDFAANLKDSFLYSAIQAPITGVSQVCDQIAGTHLAEKTDFLNAPEQAKFGTAAWHAQQIGSGLGMAADFLVANKFIGGAAGKLAGQSAEFSTTAAIGRSAFTGAVFQGVFTPSQGTGNEFWMGRLENAGSGALTFGALTGASIGLRSMLDTAAAGSGVLTKILKSDASIGTMAGIPAGAVSAESNSLLHGKGFASGSDVMQSAYGFVVAGGPLGLLHGLGVPEGRDTQVSEIAQKPVSTSAGETSIPARSLQTNETSTERVASSRSAENAASDPDLAIAASDRTATQWDSLKLEWKIFNELDVQPKKIDLTKDAGNQVESVRREDVTIKRKPPHSDDSEEVTVPGLVFKLVGRATEIVVPDGEWRNMDLAREWRQFAAVMSPDQKSQFDELMRRSINKRGDATTSAQDAYFKAILPEQLGMLLDELPNPSIIKRLVLWPHPADRAAADAAGSDINLYDYQRFDAADLRHVLFHEWAHVADHQIKNSAFFFAADLEKNGYFSRPYAETNNAENLAVHFGEEFLSPDADNFFILAKNAPLRVVVLNEMLRRSLDNARNSDAVSPYVKQFADRVNYVDNHVVPEAADALRGFLKGDHQQRSRALLYIENLAEENPQLALRLIDANELRQLAGAGPSSQPVQPEEFADLMFAAKQHVYLDAKIEDTYSDDPQTRQWAYESLDEARNWPVVQEAFPKLIAGDLAAGGDRAAGVLRWLYDHSDKAAENVDTNRLDELILNDQNPDAVALAMAVRFSPSFVEANGLNNSPSPEMVARAKGILLEMEGKELYSPELAAARKAVEELGGLNSTTVNTAA